MTRLTLALLLCSSLLACASDPPPDDDPDGDDLFGLFDDLVPDRDEYVFPPDCPDTDDLDMCGACCETKGFEQAAIYLSDCGCQNTETNNDACAGAEDGDACGACCTDNGYSFYFFLGNASGGDCSCMRGTKVPNPTP